MKVVHIAYQYGLINTGGAAIAATRLHLALQKYGIDSHYVCVYKRESGKNVHVLPDGWKRVLFLVLTKGLRRILKSVYAKKTVYLNIIPLFGLESLLARIRPDVVHVQWLNADVMSFEQLGCLRRVFPRTHFVVNLHDFFMINAIEPYPRTDRRYVDGFDKRNSTWLERWLFRRKDCAIHQLKNEETGGMGGAFVGPSEWIVKCCRQSIIGKGSRAYFLPNIIDSQFRRVPICSRLGGKKFVLLYGAHKGRVNWSKGFDDLVQALACLPSEVSHQIELRVFGEYADDFEMNGIMVRFLGDILDSTLLVKTYNESDGFAFPSREETQGMTKIEAMLCGLPVVAFDRTACAEGIEHGVSGWIAKDGDLIQYAEGIQWMFGLWKENRLNSLRETISERARRLFSQKDIVGKMAQIYAEGVCRFRMG